ncbi:post-GPI attachment to proteins factor 6-like [Babylonia areolata]|uniref:post-GPI attachment to proteins factor 6-like n=1 Tax=Babylonia areolata TaxID=304850 RepID=UPI003FD65647
MRLHTWLAVLGLLVRTGPVALATSFQQQYEWVERRQVVQYAQNIAFSLLSFTVPHHTYRAEFHVTLFNGPTAGDNRRVLITLRQAAIPLVQVFNETVPDDYILPSDQQTYQIHNETEVVLTLNSPSPGRLYLVATELNPLSDIIDNLQWHQKMEGGTEMSVMANYTLRTSMASLPVDSISRISSQEGLTQIYSFRVPDFTMSYSINISNCHHNGSSSGKCPVTMTTANSLAIDDNSSVSIDCHQQGPWCLLKVLSPVLEQGLYVTFSFEDTVKDQNVTFDVRFYVQECEVGAVQYSGTYGKADSSISFKDLLAVNHPSCINRGYLGRLSEPPSEAVSFGFSAEFGTWTNDSEIIPDFNVYVPDTSTEVRTFSLQNSLDSGGTLYIMAKLQITEQTKDWEGVVWVCAMAHRLAVNGSVDECPGGALLTLNTTAWNSSTAASNGTDPPVFSQVYLPFPTSGSWYMAMQSQCRGPKHCEELPKVQLSVRLVQCAPNNCGRYGYCQIYTDANLVFAGCDCYAGYRGLLCNDDTYSLSDGQQLRAVYLLTLSNLSFLPAICLALYRCYFTLAAIFFFNAFFSAFYHACDASPVFKLCIMDYNTLAFCDFFGSILSFYSILLFMARIPDRCRAFLLVTGALVIAVFMNSDRHNDLVHIMPLVVAGVVLIISWALVMWSRKKLFPTRRRYLCFLLPGVVLAAIGIGVNYGLMWHQSTYQYTHSFWHFSLMVTPCFLMPPRASGNSGNKRGLSISAQDIIRSGQPQQSESLLAQQDDDGPAMFDASMNSINAGQNLLI